MIITAMQGASGQLTRGVLVVTQGGAGAVWRLPDLLAVRLHPLVQLYDVVASGPEELLHGYGREGAAALGRLAPSGPLGDRVRRQLAAWCAGSGPPDSETLISVRELWGVLMAGAAEPPADPTELVGIIVADRRAVEGVPIRVRSGPRTNREEEEETEMSEVEKKARRARIKDDAVIHMKADDAGKKWGHGHNPKREGTASHTRFSHYKDGITVKEAKDAGLTATDIAYDQEHGYITVKDSPAVKHGVEAKAA